MGKKCSICNELKNKNYPLLNRLGLESTILAENENWAIIPTVGSIIKGYIMIVNKVHYNSIATCPTAQYDELEKIINKCRQVLEDLYNRKCILFEHGALDEEMTSSNSINHIHIHVVPLGKDISDSFIDAELHVNINNFYELKDLAYKNKCAYLFYEDCNGKRYYIKDQNAVFPSQFFRIQIAKAVNRSDVWNWRECPNYNELLSTIEELKDKITI